MTFEEARQLARPHSLVTDERLRALWDSAALVPEHGDFAELGVYRGGSALLLHLAAPKRILHLYDTFAGHPSVQDSHDSPTHGPGRYADTRIEQVLSLLASARIVCWPGVFPFSFEAQPYRPQLALIHLDVDLYYSTAAACRVLIPCLLSGGRLICDDYGEDECAGARIAIDDYAHHHKADVRLTVTDAGQAILIRC